MLKLTNNRGFPELKNKESADFYYWRIVELFLSRFRWENVPNGIDPRYLELMLFSRGQAILFYSDEMEMYLSLQLAGENTLDVYGLPENRAAIALNGANNFEGLTPQNSVIVFNNMLHMGSEQIALHYSNLLWDIDRTISVNARAQKTPVLITCDESQRLTLKNLYQQYDGNAPIIFGNKALDISGVSAVSTGAPYVADKLTQLKTDIWNECLTVLGITNVQNNKKERMIVDEVTRLQGGTLASRNSALYERETACEKFNKIFGTNMTVQYNDGASTEKGGDDDGSIYNDGEGNL